MKIKLFFLVITVIVLNLEVNSQFSNGNHTMCSGQTNVRDGQLGIGDDGRPYFIGTDNRIHNLWWNGSSWNDGVLNYSAPTAASGSGLAFAKYFLGTSQYGDYVYYARDYNNKKLLYYLTWVSGSGWLYSSGGYYVLPNSVMNKKPDNRICYIGEDGDILHSQNEVDAKGQALLNPTSSSAYFVADDSKVHHTYYSGGYYHDDIVNSSASTVKANTELARSSNWIFHVDQNNRIRNLNSSSNWVLNYSAPTVAVGTGMVWGDNKLFYVDYNYRLRYMYWTGSYWAYSSIIGDQVKSNTKLAFKDHRVYYVGSNGKIKYYQFSGKKSSITNEKEPPTDFMNNNLLVYPNPAKDELRIQLKDKVIKQVQLVNINGSIIKNIPACNTDTYNINIQQIKPGIYVVRIIAEDGVYIEKVQII